MSGYSEIGMLCGNAAGFNSVSLLVPLDGKMTENS